MRGGEYKYKVSKMHLKLRDQHIYTKRERETVIQKLHGNCKPKIYNRYIHKRKKGIQT